MADITQAELAAHFEYRDGGLYRRLPTGGTNVGDRAGTPQNRGYRLVRFRGKKYLEHRLIWFLLHGYWPDEIDHINGIRDDNRIENLRAVSKVENLRNQARRVTNTSGVMGVSWHKQARRWQAAIQTGRKRRYLGLFADWFEAVCARKSAENRLGFHPNHGRAA